MLKWQRPDIGYRKCRNRRDHAILCFEECARDKTKMDLAFAGIAEIRTVTSDGPDFRCQFCNAARATYQVRLLNAEIDTEGHQQAKTL